MQKPRPFDKTIPKSQKFSNGEETKKLKLLSDEELKDFKLIGVANGVDMFHCLYLAGSGTKNFFERVWGYTGEIRQDEQYPVCIKFYELKENKPLLLSHLD